MSDDSEPFTAARPLRSDDPPEDKEAVVTANEAKEVAEEGVSLGKAAHKRIDKLEGYKEELENRSRHGKPERKRRVLTALYNEARDANRRKVAFDVQAVADVTTLSEQISRDYMRELADEYEGISYRRPVDCTDATVKKKLRMDTTVFVEAHAGVLQ